MAIRGYCTGGNTTAAGSTTTITFPAGTVAGDYLVAVANSNLGSAITCSTDGSMTQLDIQSNGATSLRAALFGKVLDAADITRGTMTFTFSASGKVCSAGVVLSGASSTPGAPSWATGAGSTLAMPSVSGTGHVVSVGVGRALTTPPPVFSFTGLTTGQSSNNTVSGVCTAAGIAAQVNGSSAGTLSSSPAADQLMAWAVHVPLAAANVNPTASFTHSETNLTTSVNGSASSDSDGTIASYSWNWGDATALGTGATASHTYAAAGTYTVALTVTDNSGGTNTSSQSVTVTAPPAGTPGTPEELQHAMNRKAGTTNLDAQGAANVWAGTTGLDLLGALNAKAGNTGIARKGLQGVLNQLAGTTGLDVNGAASRIP